MSQNQLDTISLDQLSTATGGQVQRTQMNGVDFQTCMTQAGRPGANLQGLQPTSFTGEAWNDGLEKIGTVMWNGTAGGNGRCVIKKHPPAR